MIFTETQTTPQTLKKVVAAAAAVSTVFVAVVVVLVEYQQSSFDWQALLVVLGVAALQALVFLLLRVSKLTVSICEAGLNLLFRPFHRKGRSIAWSDVDCITLRKVSPFGEFGGWGIRWNLGNTMGYVWNGSYGLELTLRNNKKVVCTIVDMEGAKSALNALVIQGNIPITVVDRLFTPR